MVLTTLPVPLQPRARSPDLLDESVDVVREEQAARGDAQSATRRRLWLRTSKRGQEVVCRLLTETGRGVKRGALMAKRGSILLTS